MTQSVPADRPIGIFDSGVGGLTVAAALIEALPDESILYLGDTARLPYGTKSAQTVERYTARNVAFLMDRDVKAVVVACNTASALGLDALSASVPVWGVIEPGAEAAMVATNGRVGVIGTESTIRSGAYTAALKRRATDLFVVGQACGLFVPLVEEGWATDPLAEPIAKRYLKPLIEKQIDTLVLGCTHYPLLAPTLQRIVGPDVTLVDSALAVARTVRNAVIEGRIPAATAPARHHLCVTDRGARFRRIAETFLNRQATLELVDV